MQLLIKLLWPLYLKEASANKLYRNTLKTQRVLTVFARTRDKGKYLAGTIPGGEVKGKLNLSSTWKNPQSIELSAEVLND